MMATFLQMRIAAISLTTCLFCLQTGSRADDKQLALDWLDSYRAKQVLLRDSDVARIRAKLTRATPQQIRRWLDKTALVRATLDSPEWQVTREWFRKFLKVQAIYSQAQIDHFHERAKDAFVKSPRTFRALLVAIKDRRIRLAPGADQAARFRAHMLVMNEDYRRQQSDNREAQDDVTRKLVPATLTQPSRVAAE